MQRSINPSPSALAVSKLSLAASCRFPAVTILGVVWGICGANAAVISSVVETGGVNEPTDTIAARWTGQTFAVSVVDEPVPGATVGSNYTVGAFGHSAPAFVDRNHRYFDDPGTGGAALPIPAYLVGGDYIMSGNDNRDRATYMLDVTVSSSATAYMLIDNRMSADTAATDNNDPPTFDATHMQWILDQGWIATSNGLNRFSNPGVPDEVPIDEGADGGINQWYSVYRKDFPAGTFRLFQADNTGQNMYGVVVVPVPEPATLSLGAFGLMALMRRRRGS